MIKLTRYWIVKYKSETGRMISVKFMTYENDSDNTIKRKIISEELNIDKEVSKEEGNDYFKNLLSYDRKATVLWVI